MTMTANGLAKLAEELGELQQVVGKKLARPDGDDHWDGGPPLSERLVEEAGDVIGAIEFVAETHGLNIHQIYARANMKANRFRKWHTDPNA